MSVKPQTIDGYRAESIEQVRSACLHLATILGDCLDVVIVVGGLVPTLLVDQTNLPEGADAHVGTADLDVGLSLLVLDEARYTTIAERLRGSGFELDPDEDGRQKFRWRWKGAFRVTVDFLIPPTTPARQPGKLHELEPGFVALVAPGLELAFQDAEQKTITDETLDGAHATRTMKVCGPAAFVAMKALAFRSRGDPRTRTTSTTCCGPTTVGSRRSRAASSSGSSTRMHRPRSRSCARISPRPSALDPPGSAAF